MNISHADVLNHGLSEGCRACQRAETGVAAARVREAGGASSRSMEMERSMVEMKGGGGQ